MKKAAIKASISGNAIHIASSSLWWRLHRENNLEELWKNMELADDPDDNIPYWTELWPSSLALAVFLLDHQTELSGRLCIDLGCGLGFTAILGQSLGANVLGLDYILKALKQAKENARLNLAPAPAWICMDWRKPALSAGIFSRIWGADIMYEQRFALPLADFMDYTLARDGKAWIAEPGRTIFQHFIKIAHDKGWISRRLVQTGAESLYAQATPVPVTIWEFSRQA